MIADPCAVLCHLHRCRCCESLVMPALHLCVHVCGARHVALAAWLRPPLAHATLLLCTVDDAPKPAGAVLEAQMLPAVSLEPPPEPLRQQ